MTQVLVPCWVQFYLPSWKKKKKIPDVWMVAVFLIIDDLVILGCILNGRCNFHVPLYIQTCALKTNSASSNEETPLSIS